MRTRLGVFTALALLAGLIAPASTLAIGTLDQSMETAIGTCQNDDSVGEHRPLGQVFTAGLTGLLDTIAVVPKNDWLAQGVTVEIRTVDTVTGHPTDTILASEAWTSSLASVWTDLTFTNPASISAGVKYAIIAWPTAGSGLAWACWSGVYAAGGREFYLPGTTTWHGMLDDHAFRTYVTTPARGTLDQSMNNAGGACTLTDNPGEHRPVGQVFTAGLTGILDTVAVVPSNDWLAQGVTVEIRTVDLLTGHPTATILASQAWTSPLVWGWTDLTFTTPASVIAGEKYVIIAWPTAGSGLGWTCSGDDYAAGYEQYYLPATTTWDGTSSDRTFRTYVTVQYEATTQLGGFKTNAALTTPLLPQDLGGYAVDTFVKAKAVFDASNCGAKKADAVACLAGQLLAAKLNVENGTDPCIGPTIDAADAFLTTEAYHGPASYSLTKAERAQAIALKSQLATYNSGGGCPA